MSLAYSLDGAPVWDTEIAGFRSTDLPILRREGVYGLAMLLPYRPDRVPVVMVHGTASSPARWAELANELLGDPELAARCQLWYFTYNTGQPIAISASKLREDLRNAVAALDPTGSDEALRHMVVVGHSQGGLLTKLTAVSSGDAFWQQLSDEPFDQLDMEPATRELIRGALFVEPLPFVERLIFIATPHRGSFLSMGIIGRIGSWLVESPANLTKSIGDVMRRNPDLKANRKLKDFKVPTAVDNMREDNPFLRTLVSLPITPGVTAHSIIPVATSGPIADGDDRVVEYKSAHLDGVASELVVRSGHSTQAEPATIEEVRRILHEHLRSVDRSR
ncbi:MAG: alpha/beta fold hydrolase [Deltaproteobacteria bacterium]|nr:alpha/beta fold hydrolase [Deltaproteobacteria bacterium]